MGEVEGVGEGDCLALGRLLFQRAAEVMPCRPVVRGSGSLGAVRSEMDASQPRMLAGPSLERPASREGGSSQGNARRRISPQLSGLYLLPRPWIARAPGRPALHWVWRARVLPPCQPV